MSAPEIDVQTLAPILAAGDPVIDVRERDEYAAVHAPGVTLIPLSELEARVGEVPTDRRVHVICKSGGRSMKAAEFFMALGIDAVNVAGGTTAWVDAGFETSSGDTP